MSLQRRQNKYMTDFQKWHKSNYPKLSDKDALPLYLKSLWGNFFRKLRGGKR